MIPSPHYSTRGGRKVKLVVLHTAEGATTVESLGRWFQRPDTKASSHAGIDDTRVETYVSYDRAAWTLRSGNTISDNVELCGFAAWTPRQWLAHDRMLTMAAQWIRERCVARGIPIRKLTPVQVAAGEAGVIGHVDWTRGMRDGTHTDPGGNFPWDLVIQRAIGTSNGVYCRYGERNDRVMNLQRFMTRMFASYNPYRPTGYYGEATADGVAEFQRRVGVTGADANGKIVGPRTITELKRYGFEL